MNFHNSAKLCQHLPIFALIYSPPPLGAFPAIWLERTNIFVLPSPMPLLCNLVRKRSPSWILYCIKDVCPIFVSLVLITVYLCIGDVRVCTRSTSCPNAAMNMRLPLRDAINGLRSVRAMQWSHTNAPMPTTLLNHVTRTINQGRTT